MASVNYKMLLLLLKDCFSQVVLTLADARVKIFLHTTDNGDPFS